MPMLTWMADVLRDAGLTVREVPGWQTRGHGQMGTVLGVLAHHTAGPATGDYPSERVVVNGRTGLAGPLCNLGLTRSGVWVVVAAGQAWHAGTGSVSWCPANSGNSRLIGVEAESVGTRDDWTAAQRVSYPRGVAALLRHLNLPAERVIGHKEWAPGRKIDPAFWDMAVFRASVRSHLAGITPTTPGGAVADRVLKLANPMMRGDDVRTVQAGVGIAAAEQDGIFGRDTDAAVRRFQAGAGLVSDGIVGPRTWAAIRAASAPAPAPTPAPTPSGGASMSVRDEVWQAPVSDYYTADSEDRMWASECLAWGTTHAAHARDAAREGLAKTTTLESKVDALLARMVSGGAAQSGAGSLSDADVARIRDAVVPAVLNELSKRTAA